MGSSNSMQTRRQAKPLVEGERQELSMAGVIETIQQHVEQQSQFQHQIQQQFQLGYSNW